MSLYTAWEKIARFGGKLNRFLTISPSILVLLFLPMVLPAFFVTTDLGTGGYLYYVLLNLACACIMAFIVTKLKGWWKKVVFAIFMLVVVIWNLLDTACCIIYKSPFSQAMANALVATNGDEAKEFLQVYLSSKIVGTLLVEWILTILAYFAVKRWVRPNRWANAACWGVVLGSVFLVARSPLTFEFTIFSKNIMIAKATAIAPDLHEYLTNPSIAVDKDRQPQKIVVIIGESFDKNHSSLYGYKRPTNPRLAKLMAKGGGGGYYSPMLKQQHATL